MHGIPRPGPHRPIHDGSTSQVEAQHQMAPQYRSLLGLDIQGSTDRTNMERARVRRVMYDLVLNALRSSGIGDNYLDVMVDRGDGVLVPVQPVEQAPKTRLLDTVIPRLSQLLTEHNAEQPAGSAPLKMRAVLHAGEIHYDGRGCFGEAVDLSCRLLDAPELKRQLRATDAPLVLVVSDEIYRSIVMQGYPGIDVDDFDELVHVQMKKVRHKGWVTIPELVATADIRPVIELDSRRQ